MREPETAATVAVLGPVEAEGAQGPVALGGAKQRAVLARLVVGHPAPVSLEALTEAVWADAPPAAAPASLLAYLSRLRGLLGDGTIGRGADGYRLQLDARRGDWLRFREALNLGMRSVEAKRFAEAVSLIEPALRLWRSDQPLGRFADEAWAVEFCAALVQGRHRAACGLATAQLAVGAFGEALAALTRCDAQSYDEAPVELAMRIHYAAGRQSHALAVYDAHRRRLAADLGLRPSRELTDLHLKVLRQEPDLTWSPPERTKPPRLLPPRVHRLTGRAAEVAQIEALLQEQHRVVLHGLAGAGKTSIAAEVAHGYPGAVCWVAADDETAALGALTELGFQLGLPRGLGREQLLRTLWERLSELSDWLLVLDNAGPPAQARWLLPHQWSRGSVLITSLDPTWDSVATPVRVAPLATPDAVALLRRRTQAAAEGDRAGRSGNEAEVRLAQELGGLPLALEQACHFMSQTGTSVAGYLTLFSSRRAALLARGAPADHPSPATTTWHLLFESVRRRSPAAAEMLEVASFLSPDGVAWSVLAPGGADSAEDQLARLDAVVELVSCSLVDRDDAELRVHRLVQTVVREGLDPQQRKRRASAATAALRRAMPAEASRTATWPAWSVLMPQVEALLRACAEVRVVPEGLTPLVCGCATYLRYRSGLLLARSLLDLAVGLAHDLEAEHHDQAILRAQRSEILDDLGLLEEARADILAALTLAGPAAVSTADVETARTWARLAHVLSCADERTAAVDLYSRAILVLRAERELEDLVNALIGLAYTHWGQDDHVAAAEDSRQAVALLEQAGWTGHPLHAASISALGMMLHEVGRYEEARDLQLTALRELRLIHGDVDHHDIAYVHDKLGYVQGLLGDHRASLASHQSASDMLTALFGTHDSRRAVALSNRGLAERALGDVDAARRSQQEAYTLLLSAFGTDHKLTRLVRDRLAELAAPPPR